MSKKLYLNTIDGKIIIIKSKIVAVAEAHEYSEPVSCHIWVDESNETFNVLEDFEYVSSII